MTAERLRAALLAAGYTAESVAAFLTAHPSDLALLDHPGPVQVRLPAKGPAMTDPTAQRSETRAVLGDPVYREAFDMAARGEADCWTSEQRAAVARARTLTGTPPPGYPVPVELPTQTTESRTESEDR